MTLKLASFLDITLDMRNKKRPTGLHEIFQQGKMAIHKMGSNVQIIYHESIEHS